MRRKSADGCGRLRGGLVTGAAHLQKSLNRLGAISVYRTVCWMFLCPRYCCRARVSWPSFASLNPQAWRSMCGWIGKGILAASPTRWMRRWKPIGLIGPPRSETMRKYQPAVYMKICELFVPREMKVQHTDPIKELSDEQLEGAIVAVSELL